MSTLSEAESKQLLARHGVPVVPDALCADADAAVSAAEEFGYPVVAKLSGDGIAHKTERGLVRLGLGNATAVGTAADELLAAATPDDGEVSVLVAPMLSGIREFIAGVHRDEQFGPCVMVGVGGVLAEALGDVAFRLAPLSRADALEMIDDLDAQGLLGALRGEPPVDREVLADILVGLGELVSADDSIVAVDVNPLLVTDGRPVAVDALVEIV